jgi:hypothetical protein
MRALPDQMSERATRLGSCPWQSRLLKANWQTFSIPINSSEGCQLPTCGTDQSIIVSTLSTTQPWRQEWLFLPLLGHSALAPGVALLAPSRPLSFRAGNGSSGALSSFDLGDEDVLSGHRQIGEASTQVSKFRLRLSLKSGYTAVAPMEVVEAEPPRRGDHHHDCHRHRVSMYWLRVLVRILRFWSRSSSLPTHRTSFRMLRKPGHHPRIHSNALMGPRIPQGIYDHRTDLSSGFNRGLTLIREGERLHACAHTRVREWR